MRNNFLRVIKIMTFFFLVIKVIYSYNRTNIQNFNFKPLRFIKVDTKSFKIYLVKKVSKIKIKFLIF